MISSELWQSDQKPQHRFDPAAVASHSISTTLDTKIPRFLSKRVRSKTSQFNIVPQLVEAVGLGVQNLSEQRQTDHPFLRYASKFWVFHCADFDERERQRWALFKSSFSNDSMAHKPWEADDWTRRTRRLGDWIYNQNHIALLTLIERGETRFAKAETQHMLLNAVRRSNMRHVEKILGLCRVSGIALSLGLRVAAGIGHLDVVQAFLAPGADINAVPAEQPVRVALQAAAGNGHTDVVDLLLQSGANVNAAAAEQDGRTALQAAAESGHLELVRNLLEADAIVNAPPACVRGRTALQAAAEGGHLDMVERFLAAKAEVNAPLALNFGRTALQAAAERGHLEIVERLLAATAEVNAPLAKYGGRTALQAAAESGHLDVVERLLAAKADVSGLIGRKAMACATAPGHFAVVEKLKQAGVTMK